LRYGGIASVRQLQLDLAFACLVPIACAIPTFRSSRAAKVQPSFWKDLEEIDRAAQSELKILHLCNLGKIEQYPMGLVFNVNTAMASAFKPAPLYSAQLSNQATFNIRNMIVATQPASSRRLGQGKTSQV
jgi:hypothetical protein